MNMDIKTYTTALTTTTTMFLTTLIGIGSKMVNALRTLMVISVDIYMATSLMILTKPALMKWAHLVHCPQLLVSTFIIMKRIFGFIHGPALCLFTNIF